jgi:hypothetical protein
MPPPPRRFPVVKTQKKAAPRRLLKFYNKVFFPIFMEQA